MFNLVPSPAPTATSFAYAKPETATKQAKENDLKLDNIDFIGKSLFLVD